MPAPRNPDPTRPPTIASKNDPRRIFVMFWYYGRRRRMELKTHHVRDASALFELLARLVQSGYEIGDQFLCSPPANPRDESVVEVDVSALRPGDLVVIVTRPPLDDKSHGDRKKIPLGHTSLERTVLACARPFFKALARSHVKLALELALRLPHVYATRAELFVHQFKNAWYTRTQSIDAIKTQPFSNDAPQTPGFVIRCNRVEALNGADILFCFAMGGTETLVLARRLRTDFSHLLERPGFTMVEMAPPDTVGHPKRPTTLSFAHQWRIEEILHYGGGSETPHRASSEAEARAAGSMSSRE
jgi:hypothetical protein